MITMLTMVLMAVSTTIMIVAIRYIMMMVIIIKINENIGNIVMD